MPGEKMVEVVAIATIYTAPAAPAVSRGEKITVSSSEADRLVALGLAAPAEMPPAAAVEPVAPPKA